jgi:hypothetical protein
MEHKKIVPSMPKWERQNKGNVRFGLYRIFHQQAPLHPFMCIMFYNISNKNLLPRSIAFNERST